MSSTKKSHCFTTTVCEKCNSKTQGDIAAPGEIKVAEGLQGENHHDTQTHNQRVNPTEP